MDDSPPAAGVDPESQQLARAVQLMRTRAARLPAGNWAGRRAARVHQAAQVIADLAADAESEPRRVLAPPHNDLALPDCLTVMVNDLLAAQPGSDAVAEANRELAAVLAVL